MPSRIKLAIALLAAMTAMAAAAPSASAITMSISRGGAVNATGTATFEGGGISVICPLTIATSLLTGPITVARGNRIGEVTGLTIGTCSGGELSGSLVRPWAITINDSLPTITSLTTTNATGMLFNIVGTSLIFGTFGGFVNCLWRGDAGWLLPMTHTAAGSTTYTASMFEFLRGAELGLVTGSGCPSRLHISGSFRLSAVQTITLS